MVVNRKKKEDEEEQEVEGDEEVDEERRRRSWREINFLTSRQPRDNFLTSRQLHYFIGVMWIAAERQPGSDWCKRLHVDDSDCYGL